MKIVQLKNIPKKKLGEPLFTGLAESQTPIPDEAGCDTSVNFIHFSEGVHNKFHKHSNDQILVVTEGEGIFATEDDEYEIKEGDVIYSPAGEIHWHGAKIGKKLTHISITRAGTKLTQIEK